MPQKVFKSGSGLAIILPKELARKYRIAAGTLVETVPTNEGLLVRPVEGVPRLSPNGRNHLTTSCVSSARRSRSSVNEPARAIYLTYGGIRGWEVERLAIWLREHTIPRGDET